MGSRMWFEYDMDLRFPGPGLEAQALRGRKPCGL